MTDKLTVPDEIIIYGILGPAAKPDEYDQMRGDYDQPRGWPVRPEPTRINVTKLQQQINIFLVQMDGALKETPQQVGGFRLSEVEISAGVTLKGEIALIGVGGAEAGLTGGLRFVFKRGEPPRE